MSNQVAIIPGNVSNAVLQCLLKQLEGQGPKTFAAVIPAIYELPEVMLVAIPSFVGSLVAGVLSANEELFQFHAEAGTLERRAPEGTQ